MPTSRALDRLGRPEVSSQNVKWALATWQTVAGKPRATLSAAHNDWAEHIGPPARDQLEMALRALNRRQAAPLGRAVGRADDAFRVKTLNNPRADQSRPWWARRWWH
jgi:hypothetical protein